MTSQFSKKAEAWSARFSEPVSDLVKRYTASVFFDKRLALFDIQGSLAHAEMLQAQGIISEADRAEIARGMAQIKGEIEAGSFEWLLDLEDVHARVREIGESAGVIEIEVGDGDVAHVARREAETLDGRQR
ncbi:MAG: hypothetical protein WKG03_04670, partial [Telluria sp.]